jgi:hypothetical protein
MDRIRRASAAMLGGLALAAPAWATGLEPSAESSAAVLDAALRAAARAEISPALAKAAPAESLRYEGPEGRFEILHGEMDGAGGAEGVLLVRPAGKPLRVVFLADVGGKAVRKTVKLPATTGTDAIVTFLPFVEGKALCQVQGGPAGAVLLSWDGRKLDVVWSSGRPRTGESRWFELEDLDGDRTLEIVAYHRRALETAVEDDLDQGSSGASAAEEAEPVSVLRWSGRAWEKKDDLLGRLR